MPVRLRSRLPFGLLLILGLAACDDPVEPTPFGTQLLFSRGVAVEMTDTALVVEGSRVMGVPAPNRALWLGHDISYEYGGLGSYQPDRLWDEQRWSRFGHETVEMRQDTMVLSFLDFGDVTLADELMGKITDEPETSNAPFPVRFEGFALYHDASFLQQTYVDGSVIDFIVKSYDDAIRTGQEVTFGATGGPDAAAFATTVRSAVQARLIGMENGPAVPFREERPVLDAGRPVLLEFDRPLDAEASAIVFLPWHEDVTDPAARRAATAFGRLDRAADRVLIPAELLTDLLDGAGLDDAGYLLYILQYHHDDDVIVTTLAGTGEPLSLPVVQTDYTRFFLRITR